MTPPRAGYANTIRVPINLSSEELSALENNLRFEFGPSVITPERVKELTTILAQVDTELAFYETQRTKLAFLLSPMRRLPNETLLHIFLDVCEKNLLQCYPWIMEDEEGTEIKPLTEMISPVITYLPSMVISSVSSRWRKLALSAPSLWVNLSVETYTTRRTWTFVGFIDTVTRYLERSGDSPLRLELAIGGSPELKDNVPSLVPLMQHACRWKMFKFLGCNPLTDYFVRSQALFHLLAELDIIGSAGLGYFEHFPRLCALSKKNLLPSSSYPYNQLEHLTIFGNIWTDFVQALRSCPSLKSLKYRYFYFAEMEGSRDNIISHDNITSLDVPSGFSDMIFSSFSFPSLRKLVVDGEYSICTSWPASDFALFISRSSCMITTFTVPGVSLSDVNLIAVLRVMPALLHLEVDKKPHGRRVDKYQSPITSHLLSSLIYDQTTSISIVPRLHSLRLTCICESTDASNYESDNGSDNEFDDTVFVRMVESRWFKPGSGLAAEMLALGKSSIRSVVLKFTQREVDAEIYEPLRVLDAEGLRVVVSGTNGVQV